MEKTLPDGLRELADWLEAHPDLDIRNETFYVFCRTPERFAEQVRALGKATKRSDTTFINVERAFGPITVQVTAEHQHVCKRRVVGTKTVTRKVPTAFREERVEEKIVEWDCPPSILQQA